MDVSRSKNSQLPDLVGQFPENPFVQRLLTKAEEMNVTFSKSPIEEQWLYHPEHRTLYVWEPDLQEQSLTYLVVILAHELGHAKDFDENPQHKRITRDLHWSQVPDEIEIAAFIQGFLILKELWIPVSLDHYEQMIEPPISEIVREKIEKDYLCCLLSNSNDASPTDTRPPSQAVS